MSIAHSRGNMSKKEIKKTVSYFLGVSVCVRGN